MARRNKRISPEVLQALWARWKQGDSLLQISQTLGVNRGNTWQIVRGHGGLIPPARVRSERVLQMSDREAIFCGLAQEERIRSIARRLGRAPSTISREIQRHGGAKVYRASVADAVAWRRARRPKRCRLAQSRRLRRVVSRHLRKNWLPQQIARWLVMTYPNDPTMHLSHETIYRTLYVQARGALKRELIAHLRRGLGYRRPRAAARSTRGPGHLLGMVSIADRAPSADTRAVPGHWEGDLLMGKRGTQIATLVERQFRFVMLVRLPAADSGTVVTALARRMAQLPAALQQSLTWDRGKEMAQHQRFTVATGMQVYFCDPQSPWQRGSNENTNGLLRQYFPKGSDLSAFTQRQLDAVALQLNTRPRQTLGFRTPAEAYAAHVASTG